MNGRTVLLINPWIHDFAAYDLWARPLGLLILGSVLRRNGCRVVLIDCLGPRGRAGRRPGGHGRFRRTIIPKPGVLAHVPRHYARYGMTPEAFVAALKAAHRPDAVLVTSMMTYWYPGVFEAIRLVRDHLAGVPVVLGGVYATLCEEHARKFSGADHVLAHQGERSLPLLLGELWGEGPAFTPSPDDLDGLPYPCFDLASGLDSVTIRAGRGCPYGCTYCTSRFLCGEQRLRDPRAVADEIGFWHRARGVRDFAFYDDALLTPRDHSLALLEEIIRKDLEVRFHCPNGLHAREIDHETAGLMRRAGFATIRLGLETADPCRQRSTGGKVTGDEFVRAVVSLRREGYDPGGIGAYILCGLPGQDAREVRDAVRFVEEQGARPMLCEYSPIPHTRDWHQAVATSPFPIEAEPLFHNNTLLPCRSDRFTLEDYEDIKRDLNTR
jgi:radical SAM superfamily enzyme YgiQ (UPF0313 family)